MKFKNKTIIPAMLLVGLMFTIAYAPQDKTSPAAELRANLQSPDPAVRLDAACKLAELKDVSGLPELKKALTEFRTQIEKHNFDGYFPLKRLIRSLEQLTAKSLGQIPRDPLIMSNSDAYATEVTRWKNLLDAWNQWWNWQPPTDQPIGPLRVRQLPLLWLPDTNEMEVIWPIQGLHSSRADLQIITLAGHRGPRRETDPLINLVYQVVGQGDYPQLKIKFPPAFAGKKQTHVLVVYDSNSFYRGMEEPGLHTFQLPREPANIDFILPPGHAVVHSDYPIVIDQCDGRIAVKNQRFTDTMPIDSRGPYILVKTKIINSASPKPDSG